MDAFAAVADPTRRGVLRLLRDRERAAGDLAVAFPALSQPAVSRHLRVLREAGLVTVRIDEQRRLYSLRPEGLVEIESWLTSLRTFWSQGLDALERHLDVQTAAKAAGEEPAKRDSKRSKPSKSRLAKSAHAQRKEGKRR